jgi:hypothetical protein
MASKNIKSDLAVDGNVTAKMLIKEGGTSSQLLEAAGGVVEKAIISDNFVKRYIQLAASDETTPLTVGTNKTVFRLPHTFHINEVRASVTTAPTGSNLIIDINANGVTKLSTKLSIDAGEKTSVTAVTPAIISGGAEADDSEISIDIDQVGSIIAGTGLKITLIGYITQPV